MVACLYRHFPTEFVGEVHFAVRMKQLYLLRRKALDCWSLGCPYKQPAVLCCKVPEAEESDDERCCCEYGTNHRERGKGMNVCSAYSVQES